MSALIFYFLILNKLINMKGDLKLSLDSFSKKKKDLAGIDNPVVNEEDLETGETVKTEAKVATTVEVQSSNRDL